MYEREQERRLIAGYDTTNLEKYEAYKRYSVSTYQLSVFATVGCN
jgi:hypothetical protein